MIGKLVSFMDVGQRTVLSVEFRNREAAVEFMHDGVGLEVEVRNPKQKRSLDANAYAWTLMDKLAAKLRTTAVEIYREMIHRVGEHDWVLVTEERTEAFRKAWAAKGIGWIAEEAARRENGVVLKIYKGSSEYTTAEMSRLIDEIVAECKEQGVETLPEEELKALLGKWGKNEQRTDDRETHEGSRS